MPDSDQGWLDVSDETPRIAYVATSGQTAFPVPFEFLDEAHLVVYQNDDLLTLTTDYTTSGEGDEGGGSITLVTGATVSDSVVIELEVPYELTTHIPLSGGLDVAAINLQFALFVMMLKQLDADQTRSLRQPASDVVDLTALPIAASRASKYLGFDADGQPVALSSVSTSAAATAFWVSLLSSTSTAATARSGLGITDQSSFIGLSNWHHCR